MTDAPEPTPAGTSGEDSNAVAMTDPPPFTPEQLAWIDRLIITCQEQLVSGRDRCPRTAVSGDSLLLSISSLGETQVWLWILMGWPDLPDHGGNATDDRNSEKWHNRRLSKGARLGPHTTKASEKNSKRGFY